MAENTSPSQDETPEKAAAETGTGKPKSPASAEENLKATVTEGFTAQDREDGHSLGSETSHAQGSDTGHTAGSGSSTTSQFRESSDSNRDSHLRGIELHKYKKPTNDKTTRNLNYGGLVFMFVAAGALIVLVFKLGAPSGAPTTPQSFANNAALLNHYLHFFSGPIFLFITALIASGIGYFLLRAAGTATKQVVNPEDMDLFALLLANDKQSFIDDYVRLSSLTGFTGMFTKVGLYGLPLATIVLTIVFTVLAMLLPQEGGRQLFDLAKLTLGAFIGSYVQRQSADAHVQDVQKQVADVQTKMADVHNKISGAQRNT